MTRLRLVLAAALALGLSACGKAAAPDFAGGTPDVAGLTLETTGGAPDGLTAGAPDGSPSALAAASSTAMAAAVNPCQPYEFTCNIRRSIVGVNAFVRVALEPVEALVALGPVSDPSDDVRVYGPQPLPPATPVANFKLTVKSLGDDTFRWKLEAQATAPAGAPFHTVMAGQLHRGDLPHRGRGVIGIDLDELHAVNAAAFTGQGKLLAAFAHVGAQKTLVYAAQAFSADGGAAPVSAVFTGWKDAAGRARVRLAANGELVAPPAGADLGNELLLSRIGYWPAVGGRTAVAVLGGDVPAYSVAGFDVKAFLGLECFGAGVNVTYRAMFVCGTNTSVVPNRNECHPETGFNGDTNKAVGTDSSGVPAMGACAPNTDLYDAATGVGTDPNSTQTEPGAPTTPDAPPAVMPTF
ncbi:MAG TPA: hypothetical protein VIW03_09490 [Anaeromyxobacter sp.]